MKAELRNYAHFEGVEEPAENTRPFVPLTGFNSQEDILACLMADLPTKTLINTEADAVGPNTGHRIGTEDADRSMLRNQSIAALKQQLSELNINADDELFKTSCLK